MKTFFKIIGIIILIIVVGVIVLWKIVEYKLDHYYNYMETEKELEKKYSALGDYKVSKKIFDADNIWKEYVVWYPTELKKQNKKYPVVVIANGTGITESKYKGFFRHLASWGFIVIGNQDENSRTGESSSKSLDYILKLNEDEKSIFYHKVDTDNIGIKGHSQGGVGAINAVTNWENGNKYKTLYTASATSPFWGQENQFGKEWSYDVTKINIPYFMIAGTGYFDAGEANTIEATSGQGICPLYAMNDIYNKLSTEYKVMGRLTNIDHGDTYKKADGYMTAWFMYWLKNDDEAKQVFFGKNAEILANKNWQDINKNF